MKYMLMMSNKKAGTGSIASWPKEDVKAHVAFMISFGKSLRESGELVLSEGLDWPPSKAIVVTAGKDGVPVTHQLFPETKEFLTGFWIVDVPDSERAYEIAARASAAPGPGGAPLNMPIEVRQIMSGPPPELL